MKTILQFELGTNWTEINVWLIKSSVRNGNLINRGEQKKGMKQKGQKAMEVEEI